MQEQPREFAKISYLSSCTQSVLPVCVGSGMLTAWGRFCGWIKIIRLQGVISIRLSLHLVVVCWVTWCIDIKISSQLLYMRAVISDGELACWHFCNSHILIFPLAMPNLSQAAEAVTLNKFIRLEIIDIFSWGQFEFLCCIYCMYMLVSYVLWNYHRSDLWRNLEMALMCPMTYRRKRILNPDLFLTVSKWSSLVSS